jgi:phosphotransferase system enzyme I (PtsI)
MMANSHLGKVLRGVGLAPGIAIGPVLYGDQDALSTAERKVTLDDVPREIRRLRDALARTREQLLNVKGQLEANSSEQAARIFGMHVLLLEDPAFADDVEALIKRERINAEAAVLRTSRNLEEQLLRLNDPIHRDRAFDMRDVALRTLRILCECEQDRIWERKEPFVVCAHELLPSMTVSLEKDKLLGIITAVGGSYSHAAILARTFGIPSVSGIEVMTQYATPGTIVVVDGSSGRVIIDPTQEQIAAEEKKRGDFAIAVARRRSPDKSPACTKDGAELKLYINIENFDTLAVNELEACDGIGLYRTEFLFMDRDTFPSEEEQYTFYRSVLEKARGRPVTFRTIDIGGDKPLRYLKTPQEDNPALGWRGVRLSFELPDVFYAQMRALIRASCHGPMRVMLPMVSTIEEVRRAKSILADLEGDLRGEGVAPRTPLELGVMIEVPSAALIAEALAAEVSFLSIGTNDLVQYVMAVDRNNLRVAPLYQPFHPAVIELLERVIAAGAKLGRDVSVCGEMAGRPDAALLLLGLGLKHFSMAPPALAGVKELVHSLSMDEATAIAATARGLGVASEIETFLAGEVARLVPAPL